MIGLYETLTPKKLSRDPEAIIAGVVVALLLFLPRDVIDQVLDRVSDPVLGPIIGVLLTVVTGGRYYLRGKSAEGKGVIGAAVEPVLARMDEKAARMVIPDDVDVTEENEADRAAAVEAAREVAAALNVPFVDPDEQPLVRVEGGTDVPG